MGIGNSQTSMTIDGTQESSFPNPNVIFKRTRPANFYGKKGRSGRKTIAQEVKEAEELITQEALIKLANSKVYKQLVKIREDNLSGFKDTKEMALPITLKGITEKKELGGKVQLETITGMEIIKDESSI